MVLLASNSRWLLKSTLTWRRCPMTPDDRIEYCGFGEMVGNLAWHPARGFCCSSVVQCRLRNWSAFTSKRTLSWSPMSAYVPKIPVRPDASKVFGPPPPASVGVSKAYVPIPWVSRAWSGNSAVTCTVQVVPTARGVVATPYRPPGRTAELYGALRGTNGGMGKPRAPAESACCARAGDPAIVVARATAMAVRRIP